MTSELSLQGCDLCCQLGDVLLSGHGGVLAQGLQGLSFQGTSKTRSVSEHVYADSDGSPLDD